jgi:Bacteriophage tail sheath protein
MAFLHGIETIESESGGVPVTVVKSAVIGLIGAAPLFMQPGIAPPWNPNGKYALGAQVLDTNLNVQECTVPGVTGGAAPNWATAVGGATAADGAVTWSLVQLANNAPDGVGSLNEPILVSSSNDAGNFGVPVQGYWFSYAIRQIQNQGGGQIIAVNVFNPWLHFTNLVNQAFALPGTGAQVVNLGHMGAFDLVVQNTARGTTYTYNQDYVIDWVNGLLSIPAGSTISVGEALSVNFSYCDPTKVSDAQVIGSVAAGVYTGLQCLLTTFQSMGFFAKLLIAPGFSQNQDVASALDSLSLKIRSMEIIDSAPNTPVSTTIANRGATNSAFFTASKRAILAYPNQMVIDNGIVPTGVTLSPVGTPLQATAGTPTAMPYSPFVAGATAARDIANGYWWSPSNMLLNGSSGPDVPIYASAFDPNSDTNSLNAAGIVTVLNGFGTGLRTWGNRSAAFPTYTTPDVFIPIRRTLDIIEESLQLASLQFSDAPISNGLIASILASGNGFIRTLVQRGALIAGSSINYLPGDNDPTQLAAGQIVFEIDCMPPPPAERITYNWTLNTALLANIAAPQATAAAG